MAFLMYLSKAYLFADGGQTMSLRWLALFCDFGQSRRQIGAKLVLPTYSHPWTHLTEGLCTSWWGLYTSWWGLGSSLILDFLSFLIHFLFLQTISRFTNRIPCSCKPCLSFIFQTIILQIVIYLTNYTVSCKLSSCKLSYIFQTISSLILQRWAVNYDLITHGPDMDLRSSSSIRAHFNSLSSEDVSRKILFLVFFVCSTRFFF